MKSSLKVQDKEVIAFMEVFKDAYNESLTDLQRMENFQAMYDNVVNAGSWPTTSKIPIPLLFTMVERALPGAVNYLFPDDKFITLTPINETVDIENIEKAEKALEYVVKYRMKLASNAYTTLKDCFKFGLGYGIVEPVVVTPPATFLKMVTRGSEILAQTRMMGMGNPMRTVRFRYICPGQVIVTQDGSDFNGMHRPSMVFFIDLYRESEFEAMYKDQPVDGESPILKGNPKEIIAEARSQAFDSRTPLVDFVAMFGGIDMARTNKANPYVPVVVPVIKVYTQNRHVWIANGTRRIFDEQDKYQTMRCPLIKATAYPDAHRWYPMSSAEASEKMALGINIWTNAMFDLFTQVVKPVLVYDKNATGNKPPERGPNSDIGVAGDVTRAAAYLNTPQIPPGLFSMAEALERFYGSTVGQENWLQSPSPGVVRSGINAFEALLQSTTGREQLAGAILESKFVDPTVVNTMLYMQLNIDEGGEILRYRRYNKKTGKEYVDEMTVTPDDLIHAYEVSLNLKAKHKFSSQDAQQKITEFQMWKDDPYIDQYELRRRCMQDEWSVDRLLLPREKAKEIEDERRNNMMMAERNAAVAGEQATEVPVPERPEAQGAEGMPSPIEGV